MSSDFPVIPTTIENSSEQFIKCREKWKDVLTKYEEEVRWCVSEGQDKYVNRHIERGMLLGTSLSGSFTNYEARDRIKMLLDPDAPFLELCIFAGYQQSGSSPCASVVAGIGVVRCSPTI
jgi:acetyl-CoA carboxylase carboxyltransferase component